VTLLSSSRCVQMETTRRLGLAAERRDPDAPAAGVYFQASPQEGK
jgi:hypothetical protein